MKKIFLPVLWCVLLFASVVQATVYRGAMDNRTGFTPLAGFTAQSNAWHSKGMRIEWTVDDETNPGYWTYSYRMIRSVSLNKAFALFDIETASDFTAANIINYSVDENYTIDRNNLTTMADPSDPTKTVTIASQVTLSGPVNFNVAHNFSNAAVTEASTSTALNKYDLSQYSGDPGRTAPGVVGGTASATPSVGPVAHPFYGLRWTFPGTGFNYYVACAWRVTLVTDRAPMWGSFFGWGDQTSTAPYWYANLYSNNIDSATRPAAAPASTVDETGAALAQFDDYQGWALVPGYSGDTDPPTVSTFAMPASCTSLTVPVTFFTAADNVGVTGYLITESPSTPSAGDPGWNSTPPQSFTFSGSGARTAYAWARDAAGNVSEPYSAPVTISLSYDLTLSFSGTGGGSVSGSLSCSSTGTCDPASFAEGTAINLIATPDGNSLFAGWSGACANGSGDCSFTMDGVKSVTATFNEADKARIGSSPYATLASAFAAAASGTVQARSIEFAESPVITVPTVFKGGYNSLFTSNSGNYTTLNGTLTVGTGSLTVEGMVIR